MSIRNSMYRMVFLLIFIPFLLFTILITYIYSNNLEKVLVESLQSVSNTKVVEMSDFCEYQRDYLSIIGAMEISRSGMRGELNGDTLSYLDNMLYSRVQLMGYLKSLAIIDNEKRVIACSREHKFYANKGMDILIEKMGEKPFFISDILKDEHGHKTLVALARIEDDDGGGVLGYILAELSTDFYDNIRKKAELWNNSTFYLLDGSGQIICAGTQDEGRADFVTTADERMDFTKKYGMIDFEENPRGSFQYKVGNKVYITYYSDVGYTDWRVLLTVNLNHYQNQKAVFYLLASSMLILCVMLAVWIGWFASRRIVSPIKDISETLSAIQSTQDYSLRVKIRRKDELGNLSMEINELVDYIETEDLYKTQQQRLLQEKAEQDALTKVSNRERITLYFQEAVVSQRLSRSKMAVLFVDIDDFKAFNTMYGHGVGDQVLLFLASLLARETNGIVGRLGGDEFLVIVEMPDYVENLENCLKQVEKLAGTEFVVRGSGVRLPVSCCIGAVRIDFAKYDYEPLSWEELVDMADRAMYYVKNNGKKGHVIVEYGVEGRFDF